MGHLILVLLFFGMAYFLGSVTSCELRPEAREYLEQQQQEKRGDI